MAVPFVDSLTTNLDHSLPLTVGEFDEFGNAKEKKDHLETIINPMKKIYLLLKSFISKMKKIIPRMLII